MQGSGRSGWGCRVRSAVGRGRVSKVRFEYEHKRAGEQCLSHFPKDAMPDTEAKGEVSLGSACSPWLAGSRRAEEHGGRKLLKSWRPGSREQKEVSGTRTSPFFQAPAAGTCLLRTGPSKSATGPHGPILFQKLSPCMREALWGCQDKNLSKQR